MSDIVERLRGAINRSWSDEAEDFADRLLAEAADEIERLRERNNVLEIAHRQTQKTLDKAYAKIERLEAGNTELLKAYDELIAEEKP